MKFCCKQCVRTPNNESFLCIRLPLSDLANDLVLIFNQLVANQSFDSLHCNWRDIFPRTTQAPVILEQFHLGRPPSILPCSIDNLVREVPIVLVRLWIGIEAKVAWLKIQLPISFACFWRKCQRLICRHRRGWLRLTFLGSLWRGSSSRTRILGSGENNRGRGDGKHASKIQFPGSHEFDYSVECKC